MATDLRIKAIDGGYRILGVDANGVEVVADWTTYATEQDARDAMEVLADDLDTIAMERRNAARRDAERAAE